MLRESFPKVAALGAAAAAAVLLTGCGAQLHLAVGTPSANAPQTAAAAAKPVAPALKLSHTASWTKPLTVAVTTGQLNTVTVTDRATKDELTGVIDAASGTWVSDSTPLPGASYDVLAAVTAGGATTHLTGKVSVTVPASSEKMGYGILPGTGAVVGVNAPIVIRFNHSVTRKAEVEQALHVASSVPVLGAWHWINSSELHFRPKTVWPAHAKVRVTAALLGVPATATRYGSRSETIDFVVGDAHLVRVNDKTHTFTMSVNGKVKYVWPTSLGRPLYETRTGNYIVLEKDPLREMTSCGAKITCDKTSKDYYDLKVQWATRLSWSGTFIHAAPWSVAKQGFTDGSHGCIHLTTDRAKTFFDLAQYGDLVAVVGTSRPINDLLQHGDPGASDWNTTWSAWVAGSALGAAITTDPLTA